MPSRDGPCLLGYRFIAFAPSHRVIGEGTVEQGCAYPPSAPVFIAATQRSQYADDGQIRRADAGEGKADEDGTIPVADLVSHTAKERLYDRLVRWQVGVAAVFAECGNRYVQEPMILKPEGLVAKAKFIGHTRLPALHEYIGSLAERRDSIACLGVGQVDRNAAFPATED
jgi:hypothetical protein